MMRASSLTGPPGLGPIWRRPEALLGVLAAVVFLGALGSVEMWGKREQRASLEAADTLKNHHWLTAWVNGHPRLEKPPLSRWAIASLMALTGRTDEAVVRLPSALAALAMAGLVYLLGRRIEGRAVGLAAALILCSTPFFIAEMRQAGNDGLLAVCTTLALYAVWRRLEGGSRVWARVGFAALGFGVLAKGPIVLMLVGATVVPYLAIAGTWKSGLRSLYDGWGLFIFLAVALSWPIMVVLDDPNALGVWGLEMGQKTGLSRLMEHRRHSWIIQEWPGMVFPWLMVAGAAVALPFWRGTGLEPGSDRGRRASPLWFPWCWAVGNLLIFCLWRVAKPSYYLPCLPGMAVLLGAAWVRLAAWARLPGKEGAASRFALQTHWVTLFVGAGVVPLVVRPFVSPDVWPWTAALGVAVAAAVVLSAALWRRGADALSLAPLTGAAAVMVLIGYGIVAPSENADRGHRALARAVDHALEPADARILFLQDLDEGLSFYLRDRRIEPVPGSERRYNSAFDFVDDHRRERRDLLTRGEVEAQIPERLKRSLVDWIDRDGSSSDYLLIPARFYDRFAADLAPRTTEILRDEAKKRGELVLLRVADGRTAPVASAPGGPVPTRR